ncbi:Scr1 family TA system antitoxin-like transcriptional regulator [Glycomyces artemisiae]|uniref:Helix-turn-helix protein n=1 Tax=Glycomyces artemisiae TaxID=1076443 RepID=A0A2T0USS9_9ACTN|nr:Scr1 family TA system antitoxin-like transcriptional regulator [Glycomyces artemisiae]PRY60963.1 helix-turn-helix protein [Glycomyces artemisiae]
MVKPTLSKWYGPRDLADCIIDSEKSDAEVAQALDYSTQTISNWKKGKGQPSVGDVREIITLFGGADEERILYVQKVVRTKKADQAGLEFDPRFNAILLQKGERHYNYIFTWEPDTIPGPFQTDAFHYKVLQPLEETSDEVAEFGHEFKQRRARMLELRGTPFQSQTVIGESALLWLRELEAGDRREQLELLREWNARPNFELRIMAKPHTLRGHFVLFLPEGSPTAGPGFVFTEIRDRTTCIEEPERVKLYTEPIEPNWHRATPLEEYLDAERERLA